jgi:hypothetical protein
MCSKIRCNRESCKIFFELWSILATVLRHDSSIAIAQRRPASSQTRALHLHFLGAQAVRVGMHSATPHDRRAWVCPLGTTGNPHTVPCLALPAQRSTTDVELWLAGGHSFRGSQQQLIRSQTLTSRVSWICPAIVGDLSPDTPRHGRSLAQRPERELATSNTCKMSLPRSTVLVNACTAWIRSYPKLTCDRRSPWSWRVFLRPHLGLVSACVGPSVLLVPLGSV